MTCTQLTVLGLFTLFICFACQNNPSDTTPKDGQTLARQYCASCHIFPEPSLLPKHIWQQKVMPNMASRMGMKMGYPYKGLDPDDIELVTRAHVIPDTAMISEEDMFSILKYYIEAAPNEPLPQVNRASPAPGFKGFSLQQASPKPDMNTQNVLLYPLGDRLLMSFEGQGAFLYAPKSGSAFKFSPVVAADAAVYNNQIYLLEILNTQAYNKPAGALWGFPADLKPGAAVTPVKVIDSLTRPVDLDVADLNHDSLPDFIICEFGDYLGRLSLHLSRPGGYSRVILSGFPGACAAWFRDMDQDGITDIVALHSQAREGIIWYKGGADPGRFEPRVVAEFPPAYGCNGLEIADLNGDQRPDLILTNGDNADISSCLKNYHGVRIYINEGNGQFKATWFYPMHGASGVQCADFDGDNDLDFAVIAHFPDFSKDHPENSLYFENTGSVQFQPMQMPFNLIGRPLRLLAHDYDSDGRTDLVVGNYIDQLTSAGPNHTMAWKKENRSFWLLKNQKR